MGWLVLSLLFGAQLIEATSNGVGLPCDVDNANLGNANRARDTTRTMWWVLPPAWAGTQYTLKTADPSGANDPTGYVPGQWMNIYIRTTNQDAQFTGLVMYAVNAQGMKVGKWQVPFLAPYHSRDDDQCVVHSNADPKNYVSMFKFQGPPVGTGTVTIKALIKFGLAFPSTTGTFFWPNSAPFTLTEKPQAGPRVWYEGRVGESCITVCVREGLGCDLPTMKQFGKTAANLLDKAGPYTNCTGPVLPGCSPASPNVGAAGCFYHDDTCTQPPAGTAWVRNDPCEGLLAWDPATIYNIQNDPASPKCCIYNGSKWCANYNYVSGSGSGPAGSNPLYGAWAPNAQGRCKPAGGWPAGQGTVPLVPRVNPGPSEITCEAVKTSVMDGQRICACSTTGQRTPTGGASQLAIPLAVLLLPVLAL